MLVAKKTLCEVQDSLSSCASIFPRIFVVGDTRSSVRHNPYGSWHEHIGFCLS